jgi:hypothetical protein
MSLEAKIEDLTNAINALVTAMGADRTVVTTTAAATPVVHVPPVAPVPVASPAPAPAMPAPPVFAAPAPVAPAASLPKAPFTDQKSLIDYVMSSYKALGVAKGAQIQQVLVALGHQNINDVKPEHYAALHTGVEALKG